MNFETITSRTRDAIQQSIIALELPGFNVPDPGDGPPVPTTPPVAGMIVQRKNPEAAGLISPAIVLSPARGERRRSPAGQRVRVINTICTLYFRRDDSEQVDDEMQVYCSEAISAIFDLPPEFPEILSNLVPEAQESRVVPAEPFVPAVYRYAVDLHRMVISIEICQRAGVLS